MGGQVVGTTVYRFADAPWHVPNADGTSGVIDGEVGVDACGRKFLAQGDGGFFVQVVKMPPGFDAPGTRTTIPRSSWCWPATARSTGRRWGTTT